MRSALEDRLTDLRPLRRLVSEAWDTCAAIAGRLDWCFRGDEVKRAKIERVLTRARKRYDRREAILRAAERMPLDHPASLLAAAKKTLRAHHVLLYPSIQYTGLYTLVDGLRAYKREGITAEAVIEYADHLNTEAARASQKDRTAA